MLRSTLRQMASISGRTILAIGLVTGAMTAFTSTAKAAGNDIYVNNPPVGSVAFTQTAGSLGSSIAISATTGLPSTKIGTLNVQSNDSLGYTVTASSTNNGSFKLGSASLAYTMQFAAFDAPITTVGTAIEDLSALDANSSAAGGQTRDVKVAIATSELSGKPAGDYSDTITFTYTAK